MRLQRRGRKKQPIYRLVVQDARVSRDGKVIDILGQYDPNQEPSVFDIKDDSVKEWLKKGVLPTKTVEKLLIKKDILSESKVK